MDRTNRVGILLLTVFFSFFSTAWPQARGQTKVGAGTTQSQSPSPQPAPSAGSTQAPKAPSSTEYPADYIPCVFTLRELLGLRLNPVSPVLTSADEEDLKERLISEVTAQANTGGMDPETKSEFLRRIAEESFEGLTPSQALAKVIAMLKDLIARRTPIDELKYAAQNLNSNQLLLLIKSQLPLGSLSNESDASGQTDAVRVNQRLNFIGDFPYRGPELLLLASNMVSTALVGTKYSYPDIESAQKILIGNLLTAAKELEAQALVAPGIKRSTNDLVSVLAIQTQQQDVAVQAIIESARAGIAASFQRPQDVGCAMSVLSWNEMRYAFGRIIANEYIGIQIVVRNLNDKQEFALHDAELSIDTDINGRYGRFYSGRDKLVVRGLSLAQADSTPRNFVVHVAEAAGTIMSAALPVAGNVFKDAVGVYNGGFIPGLKTVWTDHSVDQLNLLNDIGFSSSTNYKTVVPKSGSVMFVIFIPSKQFEEGWWVQSCAEHIFISRPSETSRTATSPAPPSSQGNNVGIDLNVARDLCRTYGTTASPSSSGGQGTSSPNPAQPWAAPPKTSNPNPTQPSATPPETSNPNPAQPSAAPPETSNPNPTQPSARVSTPSTVLSVASVPYRKWSPIALAIFRELSWAVVAGTHIQEVQTQSAITELKCPTDDLGNLLFNKTGTLSCDVAGEGLDKIATLRLRNAQDATDTDTADGPLTVSGDPTKGKVTFQLSKLGNLAKPAYKVYAVTTTGVETFANQTVHLSLDPFETDVSPLTSDPEKQESVKYTLKGFHLDRIAKVELFESSYSKDTKPLLQYDLDPGATANQASFTLKCADDDLKKKASEKSGEKLQVVFLVKNSNSVIPAADLITLLSSTATADINPKEVSFSPQKIGTKGESKTVTVENSGTATLGDFEVKITGTSASDFSVAMNLCGSKVEVHKKCTINVTFAPHATGKFTAALEITYKVDELEQAQSVVLTGTGASLGTTPRH